MFGLPDWVIKYGAIALVLIGVLFALHHLKSNYDDARRAEGAAPYIEAEANQKREAAALLDKKTAEVAAAEKQRDENTARLVGVYSDERIKLEAALNAERLAHGRLRDSAATRCGNGSSSPTGKETDTATSVARDGTGNEISERLDGLLWNLIRDTAATIKQYEFCQAYATSISAKE